MGATAQALGAAMHEHFDYDEEGNLLTPNFYDYHVPHALDMPPLQTGYHRERRPRSRRSATKGMGEGGGAGHPRRLRRACRTRCAAAATRSSATAANPYQRVWEMLEHPERDAASSSQVVDA